MVVRINFAVSFSFIHSFVFI